MSRLLKNNLIAGRAKRDAKPKLKAIVKKWKRPFQITDIKLKTELGNEIRFDGGNVIEAMNEYTLKNLIGLLRDELKKKQGK